VYNAKNDESKLAMDKVTAIINTPSFWRIKPVLYIHVVTRDICTKPVNYYYLRQPGYVSILVCLFVCFSAGLFC